MSASSTHVPCEFLGVPAFAAENERLRMLVVPAWGSRVVSLLWKPTMTELLRKPESPEAFNREPLLHGIPVLFPPNRIDGGRFRFNGREYQFAVNEPETECHSHGLVHDKEWKVRGSGAEGDLVWMETVFDSADSPETLAQLPQRFTIVLRMAIEGGEFRQTAIVRNHGDESFPWGLGYHTSFRFPFGEGGLDCCSVQAPVGPRWELDGRFLPTGRLVEEGRSAALREGMDMEDELLDDVFLANAQSANAVTMTDRAAGLKVVYTADSRFKQWVLHNGDGRGGYFCPEPYTCVTNGFNMELGSELTGVLQLEPGCCAELGCSISISSLPYHKASAD